MWASIWAISTPWCSWRNRWVSASRNAGIFGRSRPFASSASTCGSATQPIKARIISRPDTPITSVATVASFTLRAGAVRGGRVTRGAA